MKTHLVIAVVIQHHPISHDIKYFPEIFQQMTSVCDLWIMVLDKGYDAKCIREYLRNRNIRDCITHKNYKINPNETSDQENYNRICCDVLCMAQVRVSQDRNKYEKIAEKYLALIYIASFLMYCMVLR
jgi:hypothetical protein